MNTAKLLYLLYPDERPDHHCPLCGSVNPGWGYYKDGEFIGCEDCVERKSCENVPEYGIRE